MSFSQTVTGISGRVNAVVPTVFKQGGAVAVVDTYTKKIYVANALKNHIDAAVAKDYEILGLDRQALSRASLGAAAAMGRPAGLHGGWKWTSLRKLQNDGYQLLPTPAIEAAQRVTPQRYLGELASWCCGPNSAARAAALLGRGVGDLRAFIQACPASVSLPGAKVGPDPRMLRDYLKRQGAFAGLPVHCHLFGRWADTARCINESLDAGRPYVALLVFGQFSMHWVCVVGRHAASDSVAILDTDGELYTMMYEELHTEMLCDVPVHFGLDRYNGVAFH